jgi:hypothetical protein
MTHFNKLPDFSECFDRPKIEPRDKPCLRTTDLNKTINRLMIGESEMTNDDLRTIEFIKKAKKAEYRADLLEQITQKEQKVQMRKMLKQQESVEFEKRIKIEREFLQRKFNYEFQQDHPLPSVKGEYTIDRADILDKLDQSRLRSNIVSIKDGPQMKEQSTLTNPLPRISVFSNTEKLRITSVGTNTDAILETRNRFFFNKNIGASKRPNNRSLNVSNVQINFDIFKKLDCRDICSRISNYGNSRKDYKLINF